MPGVDFGKLLLTKWNPMLFASELVNAHVESINMTVCGTHPDEITDTLTGRAPQNGHSLNVRRTSLDDILPSFLRPWLRAAHF